MDQMPAPDITLWTLRPSAVAAKSRDFLHAVRWVDEDPANRFATEGGKMYLDHCWRSISTGAKL